MALPRPRTVHHLPSRRSPGLLAASSASGPAPAPRWVQVDDAELLRRLQRVRTRRESQSFEEDRDVASGCWKWECNKKSFSVYSRRRGSVGIHTELASSRGDAAASSSNASRSRSSSGCEGQERGCCMGEVLATGTVDASVDKLAARFRSASESDWNVRMKALYRSQFIYGSLVHVMVFPDRADRAASRLGSRLDNSAAPESGLHVTVKTCSFARPRGLTRLGARSEQWCVVEQFRRTALGFALEFASVDVGELSLGKVRPGCVDELPPVSGWLTVEQPAPDRPLRVKFRARIEPNARRSRLVRYCSSTATLARLVELGKGLSRLGDEALTRPALALSAKRHDNSHCISCTSRLRLASRLVGRQRRCQLCFYAACADCCRREQLVIYSRYTAALDVCHRCKESMQGGEYSHLQLPAAKRHGSHGSLTLFPSDRGVANVDARARSAVNM